MSKQPVDSLEPANEPTMQKTQTIFGCCSLRTGTLTTGIICLLLSISTLVTLTIFYIKDHKRYADVNSFLEAVAASIVSILCIHGAAKEKRYSLLPWLVIFAINISMQFLRGFYLILYGSFEITMVGLVVLLGAGLFTYLWICVANYYSELRDRENTTNTVSSPTRSYLHPSAVTNPAAFSVQSPPPYTVAVTARSPAHEEKPPCYEEAEKTERERAEREQQQRQVV